MSYKTPVRAVPSELLYTGYCWETTREAYYRRHNHASKADECREIRKLYAARLWDECGVTVNLQKGFS
jgi:hypothetical protein